MKTESLFASKAELGGRYITKAGFPVTVVAVGQMTWGKPCIIVTIDGEGSRVSIAHDQLLWHRGHKDISREAITMAKNKAKEAKVRDGLTEARKTEGGKWVLTKTIEGKEHRVVVNGDFVYESKSYPSLRAVCEAILGEEHEYEGFGFFGLRSPDRKEALVAMRKVLKTKKDEARKLHEAEKAAKAATKAKAPKVMKNAAKAKAEPETKARGAGDVVERVFGGAAK
jgi:hypothetical protein